MSAIADSAGRVPPPMPPGHEQLPDVWDGTYDHSVERVLAASFTSRDSAGKGTTD